jgi:hypothetical protein
MTSMGHEEQPVKTSPPHSAWVLAARSTALQHTLGAFGWSLRSRRGGITSCELYDRGHVGVEVHVSRNGRLLFSRHCDDWTDALAEADAVKADYLQDGAILMQES